ncbi:MAG: 5-methyltetrahydrofolate--homocysteine methyltransferase [Pyrinomonadaceae bacterium]|jgi:5-methyltetrahydrofolate--homocysteine methyltransferase|nr:5-methyltetrahydrofolate--homocysteine methyltransferase [Pyrinomonadaceae bacterium]
MKDFLQTLEDRIVVFDGAMGTNLQTQNLTVDDYGGAQFEGCPEYLLISKPAAVEHVHAAFFEVGCDVVETNSFGAIPYVLDEYGIGHMAYDLNVRAAQLAKRVAADFATKDRPRWVAGSMGPGTKSPTLGHIQFRDIKAAYYEQARGLIDGGVDLLIVETCQDLLQTKATLSAIFEYFAQSKRRVPVITQVTIELFGTMLPGTEISAALTALEPFPINVIGMNCGTGPRNMTESIRYLCENATLPVSVLPNAGLPSVKDGAMHYDETPETFTAQVAHFVKDFGVNVVGGCCGTTPEHLRMLVEAMQGVEPKRRESKVLPAASSIYSQQPYVQDNSFLIVGERVNASGSKKMRDLLNAEDWDGLVSLAREQEREGAHVLDVNVDFVGRDGVKDMHELASRLVTNIRLPLMFDSTEWEKMEAGLEHAGGKCILNSTNYEDGEPRFTKVIELAKGFGAAVVVGTIDEEGMARTADGKLKIASRAYHHATQTLGFPAHDIFFDPLALPISTGIEEDRRNAAETIEGIRRIKRELPSCFTILGVSNISFGLNPASRIVLNSVFLHEAVEAGLDAAIVNASKIVPLNRIGERELEVARQLIYDERKFDGEICTYDPLGEFTTLFEGVTTKKVHVDDSALPVEESLKRHIIDGEKQGLETQLTRALESHPALDIINNILLDGMKVVGDLFGSGQMQLPFVLQSAEVMKAAVRFLEPHMEKKGGATAKGKMILATVKGDVHDIGKNLVDIILTNNGYSVVNLGIKQTIESILDAFEREGADAIGMSGLLVKSTLIMRDNLELMNERGVKVPVVLGGAALTRRYVEDDLKAIYKGTLFYAKDAFDGLHTMDSLMAEKSGAKDNGAAQSKAAKAVAAAAGAGAGGDDATAEDVEDLIGEEAKLGIRKPARPRGAAKVAGDTTHTRRSDVRTDAPVPRPPFYGSRVVDDIPLDDVFAFVNETALFKGQWQFKQGRRSAEDYRALVAEKVRPVYDELKERSKREQLLVPRVVYGYFPCQSAGNDLIIYEDDERTERQRFTFPRQPEGKRLCLADYFAPVDSGHVDTVAFHLVTVGRRASEYAHELFKSDNYTDYLYFHGLSVESAEALAELWHKRIRVELGIAARDAAEINKLFHQGYQGSRFSFGYPACPNLEDQTKLFELLDPSRIDVTLTEEFQLEPEQSTSAIIVHHEEARYFSID